MKIKQFLDDRRIAYRTYPHAPAYDGPRLAHELHVPGANVAKTVLVRANGGFRYFVVIVPANARIDFAKISHALGGAEVRLATELEVAERCPDCELGVLPPFGSYFAAETIVDESLARHEDLFFCGDSHEEAIRINYHDFYHLEHPLVMPVIEQTSPAEANAPGVEK